MPMNNLRITPELVQYYEQYIARKLADDDIVLRHRFCNYKRKYMAWRSKRRKLTAAEYDRYSEKAWLLWVEQAATVYAAKHKDTDFTLLADVAELYGLSVSHVFQTLQSNHVPVILLSEVTEKTSVHQYIFSRDLKRIRNLFGTL